MKKTRWLWLPARAVQNVLLAAVIASLSIICTSDDTHPIPQLAPFYLMERTGYDFLFTIRGPRQDRIDPRLVVVGFDRQSEQDLKARWPVPRSIHADVIRNLKKDGASLIVYDVLFSDKTIDKEDKALDAALKEPGNVVLSMRIDRDTQQRRASLEEPYYNDDLNIDFLSNASDGFAEVPQDLDDVVRRMTPIMFFQDKPLPSMAAAAYLKLRQLKQENIANKPNAIQVGDVMIPRTGPTMQDPINPKYLITSSYMDFPAGNLSFPMDTSFSEVAQGRFRKGTFRGKIVFVGLAGQEQTRESYDQFVTAYTNHSADSFGAIGYVRTMPGVFLQALSLNALLHDGFVKKFPTGGVWVLVFGLSIAGAVAVRSSFNWRGPAVLLLCTIIYITYSIEVFSNFLIYVPWVVPSVLMLASITLLTYFERGALRRKWSGYVSPQVLETILKGSEGLTAQRYKASCVFGDIRGFTSFTTMHSPETVVKLLNMHFERMTTIIYEEQGTIDKFMGDGVMVLFGAPVPIEDGAICAVRAAWRMCEASKEPLLLDGEAYVLSSGFGVTTGWLVAGHVGSKMRHDYTVIGDVVNISSRLQGVTGAADVVIDTATMRLVEEFADVMPLGEVFIKGLPEHMECFRVVGWREAVKKKRKAPKIAEAQKTGISG
jgi:adenylate cyclase